MAPRKFKNPSRKPSWKKPPPHKRGNGNRFGTSNIFAQPTENEDVLVCLACPRSTRRSFTSAKALLQHRIKCHPQLSLMFEEQHAAGNGKGGGNVGNRNAKASENTNASQSTAIDNIDDAHTNTSDNDFFGEENHNVHETPGNNDHQHCFPRYPENIIENFQLPPFPNFSETNYTTQKAYVPRPNTATTIDKSSLVHCLGESSANEHTDEAIGDDDEGGQQCLDDFEQEEHLFADFGHLEEEGKGNVENNEELPTNSSDAMSNGDGSDTTLLENNEQTEDVPAEPIVEPTRYPTLNGYDSYYPNANEYGCLLLISLLDKFGAPRYAFREILLWAKTCHNAGFDFSARMRTRDSFMKQIRKVCELPPPECTRIEVESSPGARDEEKHVDVITFDVRTQIYRMLNDPELTKAENLVINDPSNPYLPYKPNKHPDEYQDGRCYQMGQERLRPHNEPDILVIGVVPHADNAHTDVKGRFCVEPVTFTLTIFNRATRANHRAVGVLGYITDRSQVYHRAKLEDDNNKAAMKGRHCRVYHQQMRHVMEELRKIQNGTTMSVQLCGIEREVRLVLPLVAFEGDGKSSDMLAGRYSGAHVNMGRIHWKCNCKPCDADSFTRGCKWLEQEDVKDIVYRALGKTTTNAEEIKTALDELHGMSQYPCDLFAFDMLLADPKYGIFGLLSNCCLHMINQGWLMKMHKSSFGRFSKKAKILIDATYQRMMRTNRQTEFHKLPRINGKRGITVSTLLTADEKVGATLAAATVFRSGVGQAFLTDEVEDYRKKDKEESDDVLERIKGRSDKLDGNDHLPNLAYMTEQVLTGERWLCSKHAQYWDPSRPIHRRKYEKAALNAMHQMQLTYLHTLPKVLSSIKEDEDDNDEEGVTKTVASGHRNPKFHGITHAPGEISYHGSPMNTDTSANEHNHLKFVKFPALTSSHYSQTHFLQGVASRTVESLMVQVLLARIQFVSSAMDSEEQEAADEENEIIAESPAGWKMCGTRYVIRFNGEDPENNSWKNSSVTTYSRSKHHWKIIEPLHTFLESFFFSEHKCSAVLACTEAKYGKELQIRSHPNYRGGGRWLDWVYVEGRTILHYTRQKTSEQISNEQQADKYRRHGLPAKKPSYIPWKSVVEYPCQIMAIVLGTNTAKLTVNEEHGQEVPQVEDEHVNLLATPLVVLRVSSEPCTRTGNVFESILYNRFEKTYDADGRPVYAIVPIDVIGLSVFVAEEWPDIHSDSTGWETDLEKLQNPPRPHSCNGTKRRKPPPLELSWRASEDALERDWIYALEAIDLWPSLFWEQSGILQHSELEEDPSPDIDRRNYRRVE